MEFAILLAHLLCCYKLLFLSVNFPARKSRLSGTKRRTFRRYVLCPEGGVRMDPLE